MREQDELEIQKAKEMSNIETVKFKDQVDAIGAETIASIATAGPEMQVRRVWQALEGGVIHCVPLRCAC